MMFIFRAVFWLTIGFLVVAPHGTDFGATATSIQNQAVAAATDAGQRLISGQILPKKYASSELLDVTASIVSPAVLPMQDSSMASFVFPRARPAAMG
jgi:hypothetical protein